MCAAKGDSCQNDSRRRRSDDQRRAAGVRRAAWLAEKTGAALELFACDYDSDIDAGRVATVWIPEPGTREQLLLRHRRKLDEIAAPLRERGLRVTVDVTWDYPLADAIIKRAAAERPWLVAKDTHHHTLLQRTLLTNTDWQLVRECPVPLLLVKPRNIATNPIVLAASTRCTCTTSPQRSMTRSTSSRQLWPKSAGALHLVHAAAPPLGVQIPPSMQALIAAEHRKAIATFSRGTSCPRERARARRLAAPVLAARGQESGCGFPRHGCRRAARHQEGADR